MSCYFSVHLYLSPLACIFIIRSSRADSCITYWLICFGCLLGGLRVFIVTASPNGSTIGSDSICACCFSSCLSFGFLPYHIRRCCLIILILFGSQQCLITNIFSSLERNDNFYVFLTIEVVQAFFQMLQLLAVLLVVFLCFCRCSSCGVSIA